jgi:hypothetical protein
LYDGSVFQRDAAGAPALTDAQLRSLAGNGRTVVHLRAEG